MPNPKLPETQPAAPPDDPLDEALDETFPASDPIAVNPAEPSKEEKQGN